MSNLNIPSTSEVKKDKVNPSTGILKRTVSGVRNLAVKFTGKFNKKDNCKTFHELDESDVVKNTLGLSDKFTERIKKLKQAEGKKRRGQTTGLYMQYVLERIVREYYDYKSPIPVVAENQIRNLKQRFNDEHLDVTNLLENFFDITKKLDPLAPLMAMSHTNISKKGGRTLCNLYQFLKQKGYDLYTEYRDCIFKLFRTSLQDVRVDMVESEYHVDGSNCRGRIDIYCGELIIDSKCTIKDGFHRDLSQLLLYKLLAEQNEKQLVKRVMIVNPCLSYVYTVDVSKWAGTHFKELLQKQTKPTLPRYQSDSNLKRDTQDDKLQRSKSEKILPRTSSVLFTKKIVDNNHVNFNETMSDPIPKSRSDAKLEEPGVSGSCDTFSATQKTLDEENPFPDNVCQRERDEKNKFGFSRNSSRSHSDRSTRNVVEDNDLEFMTEVARLHFQEAKRLREQVKEHEATIKKQQATLQEHEATIKKQQATLQEHEATIKKQQATIEKLTLDIEELKSVLNKLRIKINELEIDRKRDSERIATQAREIEILKIKQELEIERLKGELSRERSLRKDFERKYEKARSELNELRESLKRMAISQNELI
jgi:hypothetical protein